MLGIVDDRIRRLPPPYAEFLVLRGKDLDDAAIAARLGVPVESIPLLARLAEAKLSRLREVSDDPAVSPPKAGVDPAPGVLAVEEDGTADPSASGT